MPPRPLPIPQGEIDQNDASSSAAVSNLPYQSLKRFSVFSSNSKNNFSGSNTSLNVIDQEPNVSSFRSVSSSSSTSNNKKRKAGGKESPKTSTSPQLQYSDSMPVWDALAPYAVSSNANIVIASGSPALRPRSFESDRLALRPVSPLRPISPLSKEAFPNNDVESESETRASCDSKPGSKRPSSENKHHRVFGTAPIRNPTAAIAIPPKSSSPHPTKQDHLTSPPPIFLSKSASSSYTDLKLQEHIASSPKLKEHTLLKKPPDERPDYHIKIVCVGDGGCGKTCLMLTYTYGSFPTTYIPTVFENYLTNVRSADNKLIELALWDTAGQEEYDRLRVLSYPEVNILLVCFSLDSPTSLDNVLEKWVPEINHFCPEVPFILVGLKSDLRKTDEFNEVMPGFISPEEGAAMAERIGANRYMECSARLSEGISNVFNTSISIVLADHLGLPEPPVEEVTLPPKPGMTKKQLHKLQKKHEKQKRKQFEAETSLHKPNAPQQSNNTHSTNITAIKSAPSHPGKRSIKLSFKMPKPIAALRTSSSAKRLRALASNASLSSVTKHEIPNKPVVISQPHPVTSTISSPSKPIRRGKKDKNSKCIIS